MRLDTSVEFGSNRKRIRIVFKIERGPKKAMVKNVCYVLKIFIVLFKLTRKNFNHQKYEK